METILIVDDEDLFRSRMQRAFENRGFTVFSAANYDEAIRVIREQKPECAVVDLKMPGKSGLELIRDGLKIEPDLKIVVLTGYGSIATATDAVKLGALYYLPKPADVGDILNAFNRGTELDINNDPDDFILGDLTTNSSYVMQRAASIQYNGQDNSPANSPDQCMTYCTVNGYSYVGIGSSNNCCE